MLLFVLAAIFGGVLGWMGHGWRSPFYWLLMGLVIAMVAARGTAC